MCAPVSELKDRSIFSKVLIVAHPAGKGPVVCSRVAAPSSHSQYLHVRDIAWQHRYSAGPPGAIAARTCKLCTTIPISWQIYVLQLCQVDPAVWQLT